MKSNSTQQVDIEIALCTADPQLGKLIKKVIAKEGPLRVEPTNTPPFEALVRAITYQQISGKAAETIHNNLQLLIKGPLTPQKIVSLPQDVMWTAGLSKSKAQYIHNVAEWFKANPKTAKTLATMSDEAIVEALIPISGIGLWSINVFLIFNLGRQDIIPASDLGIRKGVQLAYRLDETPTPQFVLEKATQWQPYRSVASRYLWNAVNLKIKPDELK